jgi:phenylacetate-CoA ligase
MIDEERLPWAERRAKDDASYREQLAYVLERSPFYRTRLAGIDMSGGLDGIARLPLTEKRALKATCTPDNPFGAHLCVTPSEIVRIYSTSGTTWTPSYIPLTEDDLDNWITGSARSYGASGVKTGDRVLTTYNAGPFVAGAALDAFARIGVTHVPIGTARASGCCARSRSCDRTPSFSLRRTRSTCSSWPTCGPRALRACSSPASRGAGRRHCARSSKRDGAHA